VSTSFKPERGVFQMPPRSGFPQPFTTEHYEEVGVSTTWARGMWNSFFVAFTHGRARFHQHAGGFAFARIRFPGRN